MASKAAGTYDISLSHVGYTIIEDDPIAAKALTEQLEGHTWLRQYGSDSTFEQAKATLESQEPEVVFLDLQLEGGDGMKLIESSAFKPPWLIVLTSSPNRATELGNLPAEMRGGYVLKGPSQAKDIDRILRQVRKELFKPGFIFLIGGGKRQRLKVSDCIFLEVAKEKGPCPFRIKTAKEDFQGEVDSADWEKARSGFGHALLQIQSRQADIYINKEHLLSITAEGYVTFRNDSSQIYVEPAFEDKLLRAWERM